MTDLSLGLTSQDLKFLSANHGMSIPTTLGLTTRVGERCKTPVCEEKLCYNLGQEVKDDTHLLDCVRGI